MGGEHPVEPIEVGAHALQYATDVLVDGDLAYVLDAYVNQAFWLRILDVSDPEARVRLGQLADAVYTHVWELGGMIGGGLGDGLSRTSYLPRQFGPLCDVFRDVKRIFDPQNLLNPGKVIPEGRGWQTDDRPRSSSPLAVASGVRTRAAGRQ